MMEDEEKPEEPPMKKLKLTSAMRRLRQVLENEVCAQCGLFVDKDGRIIISRHVIPVSRK